MEITFITGNLGKVKQVEHYLNHPLNHQKLDLPEIQSLDLEEIVRGKAEAAYAILGKPVLVEDTSLTFHALGRLPGPLIKWFLEELDNEGLARLLDGKDRRATAQVCFGYHDGSNCHFFSAEIPGQIVDTPRGDNTFGWNPVFVADGETKTWAEMTLEEQSATSMRRIALEKLHQFLESQA